MKNLRNLFILSMAAATLAFAGCDDDDDNDNNNTTADAGTAGQGGQGEAGQGGQGGGEAGQGGGEAGQGGGEAGQGGGAGDGGEGGEECDDDTAAMGDGVNAYGPTTRINQISVPATLAEAAGCDLVTEAKGTQIFELLNSLRPLAGDIIPEDLSEMVTPRDDENGRISAVVLASLKDWATGKTAGETGTSDLVFYIGQQTYNADQSYSTTEYNIDPASLNATNNESLIKFEDADLSCAMVHTKPGVFSVSAPVLGHNFTVTLAKTTIKGGIEAKDNGFDLKDAYVSGYLTKDAAISMINQVKDAFAAECGAIDCNSQADDHDICCNKMFTNIVAMDTELLVTTGLSFLPGGLDAYVDDSVITSACDTSANGVNGRVCNAVGLCAKSGGESAMIKGVSEYSQFDVMNK